MSEIGKALIFFNQHHAEMTRLYEEKKVFPEIKTRHDRDRIIKMVDAVGNAAGNEARLLLNTCIEITLQRLGASKAARFIRVNRPTTERKSWEVAFYIFAPYQKKKNKRTRQIGITLTNKGLTPWVWGRGGVNFEERVKRLLSPGTPCYGAKKDGWLTGTVALTTVSIPWALAKDFALGSAGFVEQTCNVCEAFTPVFIRKLIALP